MSYSSWSLQLVGNRADPAKKNSRRSLLTSTSPSWPLPKSPFFHLLTRVAKRAPQGDTVITLATYLNKWPEAACWHVDTTASVKERTLELGHAQVSCEVMENVSVNRVILQGHHFISNCHPFWGSRARNGVDGCPVLTSWLSFSETEHSAASFPLILERTSGFRPFLQ